MLDEASNPGAHKHSGASASRRHHESFRLFVNIISGHCGVVYPELWKKLSRQTLHSEVVVCRVHSPFPFPSSFITNWWTLATQLKTVWCGHIDIIVPACFWTANIKPHHVAGNRYKRRYCARHVCPVHTNMIISHPQHIAEQGTILPIHVDIREKILLSLIAFLTRLHSAKPFVIYNLGHALKIPEQNHHPFNYPIHIAAGSLENRPSCWWSMKHYMRVACSGMMGGNC